MYFSLWDIFIVYFYYKKKSNSLSIMKYNYGVYYRKIGDKKYCVKLCRIDSEFLNIINYI